MQKLAEAIVSIIGDYHSQHGFRFTPERVLAWVNQFEEGDRKFILEEFLHLLSKGIYISEVKARDLLITKIEVLSKKFGFAKTISFLANADILQLQPAYKSQGILLQLLDEEIQKKYGIRIANCGTASKKYALYIDDILATGGTLFNNLLAWLPINNADGRTNLEKVAAKEKVLTAAFFCKHNWPNVPWRLKFQLKNDAIANRIFFQTDYEIQNNPKFFNQQLNFAWPHSSQPQTVHDYLKKLEAESYENAAFRKEGQPDSETFFSSAENRNRFESILLNKGIELLQLADTLKPNHRPLGATFPSYKTLGTGTLFFTWRNISNTTPIVFWWGAGGWFPLFPLYKRGQAGFEI